MEHYLENLYEIIEEIDGEDTDWSKELTEGWSDDWSEDWSEESDEEGDEKWGNDFSEL